MDNRKNNGGNSTKSKGIDKRKNSYRTALNEASTVEDVKDVLEKLKNMAKSEDMQAIKLYLEYYLGKPKETVETINHNIASEITEAEAKKINDILEGKY